MLTKRTASLGCLALAVMALTARAQQQPVGPKLDFGVLARITDNRAAIVRSRAESTLATLRAIEGSSWRVLSNTDLGTANWLNVAVDEKAPPAVLASGSPLGALNQFLAQASELWHIGPGRSVLEQVQAQQDEFGYWHYTMRQRFDGLPVYGAELIVHVRRTDGGPYAVYAAGGTVYPVTALAGGAPLPAPAIEVLALQGLAARAAEAVRTIERWVLPANGEYVVAWEAAFGTMAEIAAGTGSWRAFVRADNGEILSVFSTAKHYLAGGERRSDSIPVEPRTATSVPDAASSAAGTPGTGVDVFGVTSTFGTTFASGTYQLVDQTHAGAGQIRVYDYQGQHRGDIVPAYLSTDPDDTWNDFSGTQRDEVSGVVNGGFVIDEFYNRHGRLSWQNAAGAVLYLFVNAGFGLQATYFSGFGTLNFFSGGSNVVVNDTFSEVLPVSGGGDVMFHEFTHGVNDVENASDATSLVPSAIDEALGDYFGAAFRGNPCLGDSVITSPVAVPQEDLGNPVPPGCVRHIQPDVSITGSFFLNAQSAQNFHRMGLAAVSALWDSKLISGNTLTYDKAVYRAIVYYIPTSPDWLTLRESVVQAVKDLEKQNQFPNNGPSIYTEQQFFENAIGNAAILITSLSHQTNWTASIQGQPGLTFYAKMQAGVIGVNNDQSIVKVTDNADNDPAFTIGADGTLQFTPGQLGWYGTRTHTPGDGHYHAVRVRVPTTYAFLGNLYYYREHGARQPPIQIVGPISTPVGAPSRFSLEQALSENIEPSLRSSGGSESSSRLDAGTHVRRAGITALRFGVPQGGADAERHVRITVYDLSGRRVRQAIDASFVGGMHRWQWDLQSDAGERVAPGAYIAIMEAEGFRARRVLVVR